MLEDFAYEPLPSTDHIRLFTLHNSPKGEPISGSLEIVALSERNASYKALSYTWGHQYGCQGTMTKEYTIICNRKRLPVLENLHDALRELRSRREFGYIWIDFICINQDKKTHNTEKSEQVKLMTDIFQSV